jgi:cation:H+ antiporter
MLLDSLLLILSLVLLWLGAEGLVRGASGLALRAGLTPLVIGLTVVAYGTSMPEMVVSVKAAYSGQGDIALGNIVGSNTFNIAVILGVTALLQPVRVQMQLLKFDTPVMVAALVGMVIILMDGQFSRLEGLICVAVLIAYTTINIRLARRETAAVAAEYEEAVGHEAPGFARNFLYFFAGLGILVLGSRMLVTSASSIAEGFGVSQAVIGLTIVAAGTSMPELATSAIAALRKQADIAIGNVIGSNIFNVLSVGGMSASLMPLQGSGVSSIDLYVSLGFGILLLPLMRSGFVVHRWEGALLLSCYGGYLWWLWPKG